MNNNFLRCRRISHQKYFSESFNPEKNEFSRCPPHDLIEWRGSKENEDWTIHPSDGDEQGHAEHSGGTQTKSWWRVTYGNFFTYQGIFFFFEIFGSIFYQVDRRIINLQLEDILRKKDWTFAFQRELYLSQLKYWAEKVMDEVESIDAEIPMLKMAVERAKNQGTSTVQPPAPSSQPSKIFVSKKFSWKESSSTFWLLTVQFQF